MPKLFRQSSLSHGFYDQWALTILQEEMEATLLLWNWVIVDLAQYVMVFHDCYDIDDIFLDSFFVILLSVIFRYFFQLPDQIEYFKQWLCIRLVIKLRIPPDNRVKHPNNFFVIGNSCYYFHPKCFHQDHWLSCCLNEKFLFALYRTVIGGGSRVDYQIAKIPLVKTLRESSEPQ